MSDRLRCAVITTRDRREAYAECVAAIAPQVDLIVTVHHHPLSEDTGTEMEWFNSAHWLFPDDVAHDLISVVQYREEQANISRMWNLGLQTVHMQAWKRGQHYDVGVLNDDAVVPAEWFASLQKAIHVHPSDLFYRTIRAAAASMAPTADVRRPTLFTDPEPVDLRTRFTGYAYMLNGDKLIRADEDMRWWLSDDAIDWQARLRGGTVVIPDQGVKHPAGGGTPVVGYLADWFEEDKVKFQEKWGGLPV